VLNGTAGTVTCADSSIAVMFDPAEPISAVSTIPVTRDPHVFHVRALQVGLTTISYRRGLLLPLSLNQNLFVLVKPKRVVREFTPGDQHNHPPCGQWKKIQADPNNAMVDFDAIGLTAVCKGCSTPRCVVDAALATESNDRIGRSTPVARDHLQWFLGVGNGRDFVEDGNILSWLREDSHIRDTLRRRHDAIKDKRGTQAGHFEFQQHSFGSKDFRFAFGTIDRVDCEFDFRLRTVTVWLQDRYEWHQGLYDREEGDETRPTNCLHAALVELKAGGAKTFWMKGDTTVPIAMILQ
jgi:hypothetical protein